MAGWVLKYPYPYRTILWVITHTHIRTQNAGFYPTRCGYFLREPTEYGQIVIPILERFKGCA
jgi:hypothetical protein